VDDVFLTMFIQFFVVMHILPITDSHHHHDGGHHKLTSFPVGDSAAKKSVWPSWPSFRGHKNPPDTLEACAYCMKHFKSKLSSQKIATLCRNIDSDKLRCIVHKLHEGLKDECGKKCSELKSSSFSEPSVVLIAVGSLKRGRGSNFL